MATGRGVNPNSVFERTNPGDPAERIPNEATDGQDGYEIRSRQHWGVKIQNESDQSINYRVLGFTFEDTALAHPIELVASTAVAAATGVAYEKDRTAAIARLQVEIDPAAAATGDVTIVFGTLAG